MAKRIIIIVCAAGIVIVTGIAAFVLLKDRGGGGFGAVPIGGPFNLTDHSGKAVTEKSWPGQHLLVVFGYTFCPDVCPTELQAVAVALDALGDKAPGIQPIFITIDPDRDTPAILADYVAAFHPRLVGLSGSDEAVRAAARAYRVYFAKGKADADGEYFMDHSSFTYLIGLDGGYRTHFGPNTAPEEMAKKIAAFL